MIPEEVKPPDPEASAKNEETQREGWSEEDPDTARGAAFKRMFPDVTGTPSDRAKKPASKRIFSAVALHISLYVCQ